nr:type I restriction endonuclease subunit R [Oligoflexales bacterium]
ALERLKSGSTRKDRGGVIWHTQGSGKSLTMAFLATKIRRDPLLKDYKMVFITDRTDLHRQLTDSFKEVLDETIIEAKNVAHFKELLAQDSSDLITGMLQKFQEREMDVFEELNSSEKIIVLIDEAHRGHYKTFGANINTALPNAPKIALTGTPLMKNDKTQKEFGSYIDQYTIEQAVQDGATVQIIYEGRESQTKVTGDSLDKLFETYFKEYTQEERDQIIRNHGKEIAVLEAPKRIEMIAADILEHYRNKIEPEGFKAQIVAASRRAAVLYKEAIERLNGPECAVIISGNHNDEEFFKRYSDKSNQEIAISRFKRPMEEDKLSILIVKDMLLTGFDAPIEQVMYLDRKLKEHTLLQAIARVNRTRKGKEYGYIVDYYGLSEYLKEALEIFSAKDVKGALQPFKDEIPKLEARHTKVIAHFPDGIDHIDECIDSLRDEEKRANFEIDFKKFLASMNAVLPDKGATPFIRNMRKLGKINHGAKNRYRDEQLNIADAGAKVKKLIDEHIYSTGVDPRIPPTPLFDTKFMEEIRAQKTLKTQALELEYAIKNHIKINSDQNPEYYKELSKKLAEILRTKNEKWDDLVGLLFTFRESMEHKRQEEAEHYGFTDTEHAFFRILKAEVAEKYPDRIEDKKLEAELVTLTTKIVNSLEEVMKIVDFPKKPLEIKQARKKIRHMLDDTFFCDIAEDKKMITTITNRFMDLAGVKFSND